MTPTIVERERPTLMVVRYTGGSTITHPLSCKTISKCIVKLDGQMQAAVEQPRFQHQLAFPDLVSFFVDPTF